MEGVALNLRNRVIALLLSDCEATAIVGHVLLRFCLASLKEIPWCWTPRPKQKPALRT